MMTRGSEKKPPEGGESAKKDAELNNTITKIVHGLVPTLIQEIKKEFDPMKDSNTSYSGSFNNVIHKIKIDIPKFDGENNREGNRWINKVENYFAMYRISDDEDKISIASMYMDKLACDWFMWWDSKCRGLVRDWDTFKKKFFKRFQDMEENELYTKLTRLQQKGTVEEYFNELHVLATRINDISDDRLLQIAISGLKPTIQNQIKVLSPKDIEQVREKANLVEAQ